MRQVGKTTLLKELCSSYLTLDEDQTLNRFKEGNWSFLEEQTPPTGIDECQKLPALFDRVKLLVDQKKQMGRYILTGSVRFLSKKQIKESLTGRTLILELLPLTLAEAHSRPQKNLLIALLRAKSFNDFKLNQEKSTFFSQAEVDAHLEHGGLPGICFKRDRAFRQDALDQHLETLLSRDLPMLYETKISFIKLKSLLKEVALVQGLDFSVEGIARKVGTSSPTLKSLLNALEGLFLIRRVNKRIYLEDGGISHALIPNSVLSPLQLYRSFVFRELVALLRYEFPRSVEISSYRTRGGIDIPFVIELDGKKIAIAVEVESFVTEKSLKSLGAFLKRFKFSQAVVFYKGTSIYQSANGVICVPMPWIA
jgi:predicted AAA+ superfamily ATPase